MEKIAQQDLPSASRATKTARSFVPRAVRNWLRSPMVSAKWLWDAVKFSLGFTSVIEIRPGWSLTCHPAAYRCAYHAQRDDPEQVIEFDAFIANSSPGMLFFDLGAHFGLFSLAALHYGGPNARAIAVDPSPVAASFLQIQAKLNDGEDRLQVIQAAVNDRAGRQGMLAVGVLGSGYYVAPTAGHASSELSETRSVSLDSLVADLAVAPTHIKIDVEGYEAAVLRGGQKLLSQISGPIIFIEIHNQIVRDLGGQPADTLRLLRDYQYQTFSCAGLPIDDAAILRTPLIRVIARKR